MKQDHENTPHGCWAAGRRLRLGVLLAAPRPRRANRRRSAIADFNAIEGAVQKLSEQVQRPESRRTPLSSKRIRTTSSRFSSSRPNWIRRSKPPRTRSRKAPPRRRRRRSRHCSAAGRGHRQPQLPDPGRRGVSIRQGRSSKRGICRWPILRPFSCIGAGTIFCSRPASTPPSQNNGPQDGTGGYTPPSI